MLPLYIQTKYTLNILETEVPRLRKEGKKYKEIAQILNCKISLVSYYAGYNKKIARTRKNNNNKVKDCSKKAIIRNREYLNSYLKEHPCIDCGNSDIRVLEFDHVRGVKVNNVTTLSKRGHTLEKIKKEIEKCEVRCANCHRIKTIERYKTTKKGE